MLNKTTAAPENRGPWRWYRVSAPEEHLSGSVHQRSSTRVGAPEEPGSVLLRSWLLRSRVGNSQDRPSPRYPFPYLFVTPPLALTIEQDYPAYAPQPLLSPLVGFADDTNLTVAHTPPEPHTPDPGPTVTQQANDVLDVTISYLSRNNVMLHPTTSVAMIKGSTTSPTLGPQGPPMRVVETTTHLGVIQAANPEDTTLPPKLQSNLAHLPGYVSLTTKALSLSHQSLLYYLNGGLNASKGFQELHLTHPRTALQPATRAVTRAWAAHGGWPTSIPTSAIRAAWPHYGDPIGDKVKAAYTRHTAVLLHRMTHNLSPELREVATICLQAAQGARNTCPR